MVGALIAAIMAFATGDTAEWQLYCNDPLELVQRELESQPNLKLPVSRSSTPARVKKAWVSFAILPDYVDFEPEPFDIGRTPRFSVSNESHSFKAQLLRRLGLQEVKSKGFGATLRFAVAPNWAFQFRGRKRFTVAYITRF